MAQSGLSYKDAGVDIDAGNDLVSAIGPAVESTIRSGVASNLGGFGAMFDLKAAGYSDPILVAGTDGVGTKLKIAGAVGTHDTIGIDLVAMCANDLVVQGAEPLFFLDYYATSKLDVASGRAIVNGIAEGCRQAGCALIGGETAEMPEMYAPGDYDLAGFCVGAVERDQILTSKAVRKGDVILGVASDGVHSNGFSLVRRVIEHTGAAYGDAAPFADGRTFGEVLLTPTRMYVKSCLAAVKTGGVHALAHITGGGLVENLPRVLPHDLCADINSAAWTPPAVFQWLAASGGIDGEEMLRTFNCGIGMVVVCAADYAGTVTRALKNAGETVIDIGRISPRTSDAAITIRTPAALWQN